MQHIIYCDALKVCKPCVNTGFNWCKKWLKKLNMGPHSGLNGDGNAST